jgi:hypothetical protein
MQNISKLIIYPSVILSEKMELMGDMESIFIKYFAHDLTKQMGVVAKDTGDKLLLLRQVVLR